MKHNRGSKTEVVWQAWLQNMNKTWSDTSCRTTHQQPLLSQVEKSGNMSRDSIFGVVWWTVYSSSTVLQWVTSSSWQQQAEQRPSGTCVLIYWDSLKGLSLKGNQNLRTTILQLFCLNPHLLSKHCVSTIRGMLHSQDHRSLFEPVRQTLLITITLWLPVRGGITWCAREWGGCLPMCIQMFADKLLPAPEPSPITNQFWITDLPLS